MYGYLKFIIYWCYLFQYDYVISYLISSCPNVFHYGGEPEADRWFGTITFSSDIELVGLTYKIKLDRPANLLVSWDGEVTSDDNINYTIFVPFHTTQAGEVVKASIMVKYNSGSSPPNVIKITINENVMCSTLNDGISNNSNNRGTSWTDSTTRFDPSFEEEIPEQTNNRVNSLKNVGNNNYKDGNVGTSYSNNANYEYYGRPNQVDTNYIKSKPSYTSSSNNANYNKSSNSNNDGVDNNQANHAKNTNSAYYNTNVQYDQNENIYGSNQQSVPSNYENNHQWPVPDTSSSSVYNLNRTSSWQNSNTGSVHRVQEISNEQVENPLTNVGSPVVTTLTLPNSAQNKTNIDQIVQIIKNQLEQQQITSNSNKTVIVAVVNQMTSSIVPNKNAAVITEQTLSLRNLPSSTPVTFSNNTVKSKISTSSNMPTKIHSSVHKNGKE